MIKVILNGCNGKMGQEITKELKNNKEIEIIAGISRNNNYLNKYPIFKNIKECNTKVDCIIDFSHPNNLDDLLEYALATNTNIVIGTTGYTYQQEEKIKKYSNNIAIFKASNMSIGVNIFMNLISQATKMLKDYDIEIIEKHHNLKKDAPSGTAREIAKIINEELNNEYDYTYDRTKTSNIRNKNEIGISSIRGGTIVGEHEVLFAGTNEIISINHNAYSRDIFAKGSIEAIRFIFNKENGLYNMNDLILNK